MVGVGRDPLVQEGVPELSSGSVVLGSGTVVGCGFGVTVITVGGTVTPPVMVVLPPSVLVSSGGW